MKRFKASNPMILDCKVPGKQGTLQERAECLHIGDGHDCSSASLGPEVYYLEKYSTQGNEIQETRCSSLSSG